MRALLLAVVVASSSSCAERPADGFEAFFAAVAAKDADAAWDRLTLSSRAELEDLAGRAQAQGRGKDVAAKDWLFGTADRPGLAMTSTLRRIEVREQTADRAVLEVFDATGKGERVTVRREDGRWRVDLFAARSTR